MALRTFRAARAAFEVTRGTDLTPTRIIYGEEFDWNQDFSTIRPEELTGSYEGHRSAAPGVERNTIAISGRMSYTDMIWYGNLFFGPLASGTGGGADKTWDFGAVLSATSDNVKTATIQVGENDTIGTAPAVKLNYCLGDTLHMHWEKNDDGAVVFDANFLAASAATQITAFTGALSDRTVVPASSNNTSVYLDATTIGSTLDANVVSVDWTLNNSPVPWYGLNGTTSATAVYRPNHRTWSATIVRQFANATEWSIYQSKAERKVRIQTVGAALGGSNYRITLDLYGVYTGRTKQDTDGVTTETLTLENLTDPSLTRSMSMTVVNDIASIT